MKKLKSILSILSSLCLILAGILLIPLIVVMVRQEESILYWTYILPAALSLSTGLIIKLLTRKHVNHLNLSMSMTVCALAWIIISFFGSLPFVIGLDKSFIDSYFESVSGFTTTGITVFQGLESMPLSIIFWRALIQWVGGLGILTFFLFVTFSGESDIWQLFSAEGHKINSSRPFPNVFQTVKVLWAIYAGLTLLETIMLNLAGLSIFDALTHSMTSLSTGGFSRYDASIGYFHQSGYANYRLIEYIITVFMLLGGMNFLIHFKVLFDTPKYLFQDVETKNYLKIIGVFTGLIIVSIYFVYHFEASEIESVFRKTIFQVVSVMTTTGFGTEDIGSSFFTEFSRQLFIVLMIVGGSVGSTSGGIKVMRVTMLYRMFKTEIKKIYMPQKAVKPVVISETVITEDELTRVAGLFFSWLLIIVIGSGITATFSDLGAFESISGMTSAMGNIGPFYFSVAKMASLSPVIKITYIFGMLAGRLEIIPLIVLFNYKAWR